MGGRDIYQGDCTDTGDAPLAFAAGRGYPEVVEIHLGSGDINPDKPNNHDMTPLRCAVRNRYEGVVNALLGRSDDDPNTRASGGLTPPDWAARNGYEGVVEMLPGWSNVNPNELCGNGKAPLWHAAIILPGTMVKVLLGRAASILAN